MIDFNFNVCENIIENTFERFYFLNSFVYKYINASNYLAHCINIEEKRKTGHMNIEEGEIPLFLEIFNSMDLE